MSDSPDLPSFDLGEPPQPAKLEAYRVLARKYRPQTFAELIGQDAMVTTLGNAIRRGRLAHAFLLTGVRGVGKTSTARLIAKALNCIGPDGDGGPTIDPCGVCSACTAIAEGRFIDVLEQDAASNTKVEQMRELLDSVPYAPTVGRFKIYIVDEVHMLSNASFNALLKTLEEPPPHVKFIFATTEIQKVPVTVLSRCQRFDLRRIPNELLARHFSEVSEAEGVEAEPEALGLIARAAEGSARDGLSILDQAIAHAGIEGGGVTAAAVRDMLGLSDRGAVRDLLGLLLKGDGLGALAALRRQYDLGVDPQAVLRALLETVHGVTLVKLGTAPEAGQAVEEREAQENWATALSFAALHRLWQLLLKGHDEVARAALPIEACEMALLRVVHASQLPDPGDLARQLAAGGPVGIAAPASASVSAAQPTASNESASPTSIADIYTLLNGNGAVLLAIQVEAHASLVRIDDAALVLSAMRPLPTDLIGQLSSELKRITQRTWIVTTENSPGAPTMKQIDAEARERFREEVLASPIVKTAMETFPDARLDEEHLKRLFDEQRAALR